MQCVQWNKVSEWNLTEIDLACFSDYSDTGLVGKVNFECLKEELKSYKYVYELTGYYGSSGIAYDSKKISKKCREKIEDIENVLEDYPLYNDEAYYKQEFELKQEYNTELLESLYEKEFKQFIRKEAFFEQCNQEEIRDYFDNHCIIEHLSAWIDEKKYTEIIKENLIKEVYKSLDYKATLCNGKLKIEHGYNECIVSFNKTDNTWDIQGMDISMITPEYVDILKEFQV